VGCIKVIIEQAFVAKVMSLQVRIFYVIKRLHGHVWTLHSNEWLLMQLPFPKFGIITEKRQKSTHSDERKKKSGGFVQQSKSVLGV
jgi:hypothetical protein